MRNRSVVLGFVCAVLAAGVMSLPRAASAQTSPNVAAIGSFPQAMVGLGLVGAEAVILVEGGVGLRNPWILLGSGAAGLLAGGIGGYFVDQAIQGLVNGGSTDMSMVSSGILVLGLGLIIPAAIMYVSATMYRPTDSDRNTQDDNAGGAAPLEEDSSHDQGGAQSAPASGGSGGGGSGAPAGGGGGSRGTRHRLGPEALINYHDGHVRLSIPALGMAPAYSTEEMARYGVRGPAEWRVPLLTASF